MTAENEKVPLYKRGLFWAIVGGVALAIIALIIILAAIGGDDKSADDSKCDILIPE